MSCQACDKAQEVIDYQALGGDPDDIDERYGQRQYTFIRVGRANVLISGCEEHLKELIEIFRKGLANGSQEEGR